MRCIVPLVVVACLSGCHQHWHGVQIVDRNGLPIVAGDEASDIQYSTIKTIIDGNMAGASDARQALVDGKLTQGEYDHIMRIRDGDDENMYARAKQAVIAETRPKINNRVAP